VYNTWQILNMRNYYMGAAGLVTDDIRSYHARQTTAVVLEKPLMLILKRSSNSKHTRNGHDLVRQWDDNFAKRVLNTMRSEFPPYVVDMLSDRNSTMMTCHLCMVRLFSEVDVLVGVHGAGLSNMVYMRPNSAVVEMCPYSNDGRCLLGGGPFSRAAAVLAHNYMIHHPPYEEFQWKVESKSAEFNISRFAIHIRSFLTSIGRI
jgi:hypothetical protein